MRYVIRLASLLGVLLCCCGASVAQTKPDSPHAEPFRVPVGSPWLFAGFKGDSKDGVYFAVSEDGLKWTLVNDGKAVLPPDRPGELMRDPFIQRAPDGSVRMVWTWSWKTPAVIGYAASDDLVHWSAQRQLPVMANEPTAANAWAPALYWEPKEARWLIFWSSTIPGRFPGVETEDNGLNHRIFSTTTTDFDSFTPAKVFFDPGYTVIDATEVQTGPNEFHLLFKDERLKPEVKALRIASGPTAEGPWSGISEPFTEVWSEGGAIVPVKGGFLAYYDHYRKPQHYGAYFSPDLKRWGDALGHISFPAGMRHGSFLQITQAEYERLKGLKTK